MTTDSDKDKAFNEGHEACVTGVEDTKNPYDPEIQAEEHTSWNDGWADADEEGPDEDEDDE